MTYRTLIYGVCEDAWDLCFSSPLFHTFIPFIPSAWTHGEKEGGTQQL